LFISHASSVRPAAKINNQKNEWMIQAETSLSNVQIETAKFGSRKKQNNYGHNPN
jgi:hypothetical protein